MNSMWKKVYHFVYGVCYSFDAFEGGMPKIPIGQDMRNIDFVSKDSAKNRIWMVVHNRYDFQDAHNIHSTEMYHPMENLM